MNEQDTLSGIPPVEPSEEPDMVVCKDCGERIPLCDAYKTAAGKWICVDCYCDKYVKCDDCGAIVPYDESYETTDGRRICDECRDSNYCICHECDLAVRDTDLYETIDGDHICERCYSDYYFSCDRCGGIYHNNYRHDIDEDSLCPECAREVEAEKDAEEDGIYEYHNFPREAYKPRVVQGEDAQKTLCFGVELEADCGSFEPDSFYRWMDDSDLIHFEHDGSLSSSGVECITMPCSLRFHQERMKWDALCKEFLEQRFRSHDTTTCGLHVHLTRRLIPISALIKMDVWLNRWALWRDIARRQTIYGNGGNGLNNKKKRVDIPSVVDRMGYDIPDHCRKFRGKGTNTGRYQALNISTGCGREIAEIRIFKGTLNAETVLGTIESCHALIKFAEATSAAHVYDADIEAKFLKFIAERKKEYPHVFPMLRRLANADRETEAAMKIIAQN